MAIVDPLIANRVHAELDQIENALRRVDDEEVDKEEALEVIADARAELRKERPNKLRLRSLLAGLAQGVQASDSLKRPGEFLSRLAPQI